METNKIYQGDWTELAQQLDDESIDLILTSPPYWGLRDYGISGQLGLEEHPSQYIKKLVEGFRILKKKLKRTGSCYINLGDTYFGGGKEVCPKSQYGHIKVKEKPNWLQPKQKMLMPHRVVIALQEDGWICRNDIVWHKPSTMPTSVKDRLNTTFEFVFHLVKNKRYFYDLDAIREKHKEVSIQRNKFPLKEYLCKEAARNRAFQSGEFLNPKGKNPGDIDKHHNHKNPGDFWEITTQPFLAAHFAVFPEELCIKPIKSSCPEFVCKKCGSIKEKIIKSDNPSKGFMEWDANRLSGAKGSFQSRQCIKSLHRNKGGVYSTAQFKGWKECACNVGFESGIVLDPFMGAGTTALVALKLNRQFIGFELKQEYIDIAMKRIKPWLEQTRLVVAR